MMSDKVEGSELPQKEFMFKLRSPCRMWSRVPDFKLIFVIRTGGEDSTMCPNKRDILRSLRLERLNTGVFLKADEALMATLRNLKTFVTYKYPTVEEAKNLICTLVVVRFNLLHWPLSENSRVVSQAFGHFDMHCIEEVANEVPNIGPHFQDVVVIIRPLIFLYLPFSIPQTNFRARVGR